VAAAADRDEQILVASEMDRLHNIFGRFAAGDERRLAIDHGVPDLSYLVVIHVPWKNHLSVENPFEPVRCRFW
jgi:hypothetical protein